MERVFVGKGRSEEEGEAVEVGGRKKDPASA
jgi:hypothetical protein